MEKDFMKNSDDEINVDEFLDSLVSKRSKTSKAKRKIDDEDKNIHEGHRQRQYEAMIKDPLLESFSNVEALECLLYAVLPRIDTNRLVHKLLNRFGSLAGVLSASCEELMEIPGISQRIAMFLRIIFPLVRKANISRIQEKTICTTSQAIEYLKLHFENTFHEKMYIMNMDIADRVLGVDCVTSFGSATSNHVNTSAVVESVARHKSTKIIIAHNHSGDSLLPSVEDIQTTNLLIDSVAAFDAVLIDHIIFNSNGDYTSFFNSQIIKQLYADFDKAHKTHFSDALKMEETHRINSGKEYVFDLETATMIRKSELDEYMLKSDDMRMQRNKIYRYITTKFNNKLK